MQFPSPESKTESEEKMSCTTTETVTELCYHASGISNRSSREKVDIVHLKALPYESNSGAACEIVKDLDLEFPDGGLRAWLVVAGVSQYR